MSYHQITRLGFGWMRHRRTCTTPKFLVVLLQHLDIERASFCCFVIQWNAVCRTGFSSLETNVSPTSAYRTFTKRYRSWCNVSTSLTKQQRLHLQRTSCQPGRKRIIIVWTLMTIYTISLDSPEWCINHCKLNSKRFPKANEIFD